MTSSKLFLVSVAFFAHLQQLCAFDHSMTDGISKIVFSFFFFIMALDETKKRR